MLSDKLLKTLEPLVGAEQISPRDYAATGCHLYVTAQPEQIPAIAQAMLEHRCFLESLTALDLLESFELVYHFASYFELCRTVVHVPLARDTAAPSIAPIYPVADWYEREVWEMFGINFSGHPGLKHLILPDDADFHPLRKDFVASS